MRSLVLAPGRALTGCACAVAAVALAGCTGTAANTSSSISGTTLTIWASEPATPSAEQQDVLRGARLALKQNGTRLGKFTINLITAKGGELSDNARAAIADPTSIAYLGELEPGTSGQTIGITNAENVLQVSPTDTAVELTQSTPAVPGSPDLYYESLSSNGRTFARVVPNDRLEAKALVGEMQTLGVSRLYIATDGSQYGKALKAEVLHALSGLTAQSSPAGADGMLYAGSSPQKAATAFDQAVSSNPSLKLFAPSALATGSFASVLSSSVLRHLYVSSPGFAGTDLPPAASHFMSAFKSAYGHAPAPQAIFGYEAMAAVLAAMRKAGSSANNRGTVIKDFFAIRNRSSVLGNYSINKNGDITFSAGAPFVFSRVKAGQLVPFKAVQQQG
jgi:branched-chain amino acid transport system substrate-binding protein